MIHTITYLHYTNDFGTCATYNRMHVCYRENDDMPFAFTVEFKRSEGGGTPAKSAIPLPLTTKTTLGEAEGSG